MFKKILIANRGEIAVRVIRAARELDILTVAIYSEADKESLHTKLADEAVCIGPPQATLSYLNIPAIISAADVTGAEAIHPGYGFLAENPQFAQVCEESEIVFIGPPSSAIKKMGDKAAAKKSVAKAGVPTIPGTNGEARSEKEALSFAKSTSYPLMIKAVAGGGGRGMRMAQSDDELKKLLKTATLEAKEAFGDGRVYLEKCIEEPRHVEFQILVDRFGGAVHLGERDCSIQRRHQKLVEEAPSMALDEKLREEMGQAAVKAALAVSYLNAGTVEFLLDKEGNYYFMEMNTRLQVEHPVTEAVTGVDIVKEQIRLAASQKLDFVQDEVEINGHAIEFRINAEDPDNNFLPQAGKVTLYNPPGGLGVRVDSHLYSGYEISPYYDSLVAKLIVWDKTRDEALARSRRALDEFIIVGPKTTVPFHQRVVEDEHFIKGEVCTDFIAKRMSGGSK